MSQPTASESHVDSILTSVSVAYMQQSRNFIAPNVFPIIPVDKQSDKYFIYDKNAFMRDEAKKRAPNDESEGGGYALSTDSYYADVYAYHTDVSDQLLNNADAPLNPEADGARFVMDKMLLAMERKWMADFFVTAVWGTSATPGTLWSDVTSDPITDIDTAKETILTNTGMDPNTLVLSYQVMRQLKNHPDIVDRVKYTSSDVITPQLLARLFEVDRVLVTRASYASNIEGETAAYSLVAGKHALLCYVPSSPGLLTPAAGYTYLWRPQSQGTPSAVSTSRIPMPLKKSTRIETEMAWDNKITGSDLGYFFDGAVA